MNIRYSFAATLIMVALLTSGCGVVAAATVKPNVVITSPASNSQFHEGEPIAVESTSTDLAGISRVELLVDGAVVRTDPSPQTQVSFTVIQTWTGTPGLHTLEVRSVNSASGVSAPAGISVFVLSNVSKTPTATLLPTITPGARACLNSAFVSDVTVPDGTVFAPGQTFNKIWRVRNTGTCAWGPDDQFTFVTGEALTANAAIAVPATAAGATADLLVAMTAPTTPGNYSGQWRLKNRSGGVYGSTYDVRITVAGPTAVSCPFSPVIDSFTLSASTINPGQSATLSWGLVKGAQIAEIDNDIGGVATPGSMTVSPATTTTYTLTATCGSKVTRAQVTLNVVNPNPTAAPSSTPNPTPTRTATP